MNEMRESGANLPPPPVLPRTSLPESGTIARGDSSPLLRGLVWALVAIGVLGFGIWAAQKYLFNNGDDKLTPVSESKPAPTPPQTPSSVPPAKEKPSPVSQPQRQSRVPLQQSVPIPTDQQESPDSRTRTDATPQQPSR